MSANGRGLRPATKQNHCIVCDKPDWCAATPDGRMVICGRAEGLPTPAGYVRLEKKTEAGDTMFLRDDPLARKPLQAKIVQAAAGQRIRPKKDWERFHLEYVTNAVGRLHELANDLGVGVEALKAVGYGHVGNVWTSPERDDLGTIVGVCRRWRDGVKRMFPDGNRGLAYVPGHWDQGHGPLLIVEGATDVAAMHELGMASIGRPGANSCRFLAEMLEDWPADRPIIVVGENDRNPKDWPGRTAAISVAAGLATELHRDVLWSMVPDHAKDVRDWYAVERDPAAFVEFLTANATVSKGAARPILEDARPWDGETITVEEYRRQLAEVKPSVMGAEGVFLDRSGTGLGKSHSTCVALRDLPLVEYIDAAGHKRRRRQKTVSALPTHANVEERLAEMLDIGVPESAIGVMPALSEDNCENYVKASAARDAGLSHGVAVCPRCPFSKGCPFQSAADRAKRRQHLLTTSEHLRRSIHTRQMEERKIMVIDEKPTETLAPRIEVTPRELLECQRFLQDISTRENSRAVQALSDWAGAMAQTDESVETAITADRLQITAGEILAAVECVTDAGAVRLPVDRPARLPSRWQAAIAEGIAVIGTMPPAAAMRLLTAIGEGTISTIDIATDKTPDGRLVHVIVGGWRLDVEGRTVLALDGTATAGTIRETVGQPVTDITPAGHLAVAHPIIQRPHDITKGQSVASVRAVVLAAIEETPWQRIGLIGHRGHITGLMGDGPGCLPPQTKARVAMWCYYGQGPDRASNEWHRVCDGLIVAGTPRPNPGDVRRQLIATGRRMAARASDGAWGVHYWDARTVDGKPIRLKSKGYADPDWREAHRAICRAAILQAVGRARSHLPAGLPCRVFTDEPLGVLVDAKDLETLQPAVLRLQTVVWIASELVRQKRAEGVAAFEINADSAERNRRVRCHITPPATDGSLGHNNPSHPLYISLIEAGMGYSDPIAVSGPIIRALLGIGQKPFERTLSAAKNCGAIHSPKPGFWAVGRQPSESTSYTLGSDREDGTAGKGPRPARLKRAATTAALLAEAAAESPIGAATVGDYQNTLSDRSSASVKRDLREAVESGRVVRLGRGLYAGTPASQMVAVDPSTVRGWVTLPDGTREPLTFTGSNDGDAKPGLCFITPQDTPGEVAIHIFDPADDPRVNPDAQPIRVVRVTVGKE
jgi:hypothetical protein